jgi:hypothetical protein
MLAAWADNTGSMGTGRPMGSAGILFLLFEIQHQENTEQNRVPPLALPGQTATASFTTTGSTLPCPRLPLHRVVIPPPGEKPAPQVLA